MTETVSSSSSVQPVVPPVVPTAHQAEPVLVTQQDITTFALLTEDVNPIHLDGEYAAKTRMKGIVSHGMLTASRVISELGMRYPGEVTILVDQYAKFLAPVRPGDTLTRRYTVSAVDADRGRITFDTEVLNQRGESVLRGFATVKAPAEWVSMLVFRGPGLPSAENSGAAEAEA